MTDQRPLPTAIVQQLEELLDFCQDELTRREETLQENPYVWNARRAVKIVEKFLEEASQ